MSEQPLHHVTEPRRRIVELDVMRALAAVSLVLFHFTHVFRVKYGYIDPLGFEYHYGAYGTQMFFMLSGYVNAMSLLRRREPVDFVAARLIRIVPVFWGAILLNLLLLPIAPLETTISATALAANLTLLPKLFGYECIDPVMWTLQIEMLFYGLLVALFCSGLLRYPLRTWLALAGLALLVCPLHDWLVETHPSTGIASLVRVIRYGMVLDQVPLFGIGFLLYMIRTRVGSLGATIAAIVGIATVFHLIDHGKHNPAATLLITLFLTACAYGLVPVLRLRVFVYISTISYPLYLFHNNLGCIIIYQLNRSGVPAIVSLAGGLLAVVLLASWLTYRVEQPLTRRLRGWWSTVRRPELAPAA